MDKHFKAIDSLFLNKYPQGIDDKQFYSDNKRLLVSKKIIKLVNEFNLEDLKINDRTMQQKNINFIIRIVSMTSAVSVFEKVALKNYLSDKRTWDEFLSSLYNFITNNNEENFNYFVHILSLKKLEKNSNPAKWPVITFLLRIFNADTEIFIKPTTIKKMLYLIESDVKYVSTPNYQTYIEIKKIILDYKKQSKVVKDANNIIVQGIIQAVVKGAYTLW
ncbi:hypothetical protein [Mycoplasma sp. P36-A1]|uniref:hypothetical protein n=1 Tax=Mycoplasma sp. P36-A1 TaxID=3252900 RepID=UPI003C302AB4